MRNMLQGAIAVVALAFCHAAIAQEAPGTLVVDVQAFTSEKELPKKVDKQLRNGGLEWGVKDGQVVFTMVAKQFIDFPVNHLTRYGQSESLALPAGEYRVTGIGLEMTTAFSVQKILDRGAFVNEDAMSFTIEAGKTTTLSIKPVIYKDATFAVNFWMPTLMASAKTEGATEATPETALNRRGTSSIAWPQYNGPLKFVAK
ncbi:hypothetical protein J5837_08910 [Pseudoxanthomonas helianthi]|uniref:Uncharacterized protein n=1 Tax=Pseudoxanthomonas helianthi TaxID=1453541 RepID=A0A940X260_9GAMM|nr:hypothetical protein [Pseudoxanthomonas helianthi]MBP3984548.1 hypothetical protein [Pseudoxanthomonas helianthi]